MTTDIRVVPAAEVSYADHAALWTDAFSDYFTPAVFTPEILAAHECGADIVKVFPATTLGPQFIRDVRAPLPQVKLMPTGGVTLDNAGDWIRAGAVAVGLGSALLDAKAIEGGRWSVITDNARRVVASVRSVRL